MTNLTVARPYAKAAFSIAHGAHSAWSEALALAAQVVGDAAFQALLMRPSVSQTVLSEIIIEISAGALQREQQSFIRLLGKYKRLAALPSIYSLFEHYRAVAQKTMQAVVTSAFPLSETLQAQLSAALSQRFQRNIILDCIVDTSLLGGMFVKIKELDVVIDGSVRGKLETLANTLMA